MCEYCDGSKKPIETEVDGDAYMTLTPDDSEHPEGFMLDVFHGRHGGIDDGWGAWLYSFVVPRCPMCGRTAKEALFCPYTGAEMKAMKRMRWMFTDAEPMEREGNDG